MAISLASRSATAFALLPAGSITGTDVDRIGEATVTSSEATHATARVDLAEADADLPDSAVALPITALAAIGADELRESAYRAPIRIPWHSARRLPP